jgi:hypothetical protein
MRGQVGRCFIFTAQLTSCRKHLRVHVVRPEPVGGSHIDTELRPVSEYFGTAGHAVHASLVENGRHDTVDGSMRGRGIRQLQGSAWSEAHLLRRHRLLRSVAACHQADAWPAFGNARPGSAHCLGEIGKMGARVAGAQAQTSA